MIEAVRRQPRLHLEGVSKSFEGIHALQDVSFSVGAGAIHAVLGENGAGKSTLVKIITGIYLADRGQYYLDGELCHFRSPMEARKAGVVAVYQDPKMFPHLDVAENIFMGIHPVSPLRLVHRRRMYQRARELLSSLGVDLDPTSLVAGLSPGEVQFVEFARAMTEGMMRLLILDEPTASLTPVETERLFTVVRHLSNQNTSIIVISHRLEELSGLVDTVTVLRDGHHVATLPAAGLDEPEVVRMMVGREIGAISRRRPPPGAERLRVENLSLAGTFENISFAIHAGEILGMAGLVGAGRSEIARAIFGVTPPTAGRVLINGREVEVRDPHQMLSRGLAYLSEDRDGDGLIPPMSITENLGLPIIRRLARGGILRPGKERSFAEASVVSLNIRTTGIEQPVTDLSGGNRQKVALGKCLGIQPSILILDEPTHGIDVGAKAQVHEIIERLAAGGMAILLISSDLPELLHLSDRVLVIAAGLASGTFDAAIASQETIMHAASVSNPRTAA